MTTFIGASVRFRNADLGEIPGVLQSNVNRRGQCEVRVNSRNWHFIPDYEHPDVDSYCTVHVNVDNLQFEDKACQAEWKNVLRGWRKHTAKYKKGVDCNVIHRPVS